jgi:UDP-N-acetylmuramate: L-alanyl-gamma-D-glutamyl-meso-diaminopimelate ligase
LLEAILDRGLPYVSGPQWLAEHVLRDKWVLAVAGTHGKTTTTALLAWILDRAGLGPGFLIGGVPVDFGASARLGSAPFFVIEADEYDTAFSDKRSKFVHYRPRTAVLNNLEYDHADIFPDLAAIETQFHHFVRTIPRTGRLVVNGDDVNLERVLARGCWSEVERFGFAGGTSRRDWSIAADGTVTRGAEAEGALTPFALLGRHNQMNALAAIVAARHAGVPVRQSLAALATFRGVKRRLEVRGKVRGITIYDDFAHHPTAIAATVEALRREVGDARILAVLEPRSNTMKLGTMKAALAPSLAAADLVFCYASNLGWDPAEALKPLGERAQTRSQLAELADAIVAAARSGDHILVMSNGGFGGIHDKLLARLAAG